MEYFFKIPGIPPSVNHYVKHTRSGRHYKTPRAEAFSQRVALAAGPLRGKKINAKQVEILVTLGHKQRGDIDNFPKLVLDSLVRCGVIETDASICRLVIEKNRAEISSTCVWVND